MRLNPFLLAFVMRPFGDADLEPMLRPFAHSKASLPLSLVCFRQGGRKANKWPPVGSLFALVDVSWAQRGGNCDLWPARPRRDTGSACAPFGAANWGHKRQPPTETVAPGNQQLCFGPPCVAEEWRPLCQTLTLCRSPAGSCGSQRGLLAAACVALGAEVEPEWQR